MACAAAVVGSALVGFSATASAAPGCPDLHLIGAAGSGQRDGDLTADMGMGSTVYKSYVDLQSQAQRDGRTITAEAVEYPATAVPDDGGIGDWMGFMGSVDTGAAALGTQYAAFVDKCPTTKVVLAGYSQGAMVVHRNLLALSGSPNLAASLLIADGDRLPADPTINIGSVSSVPGKGKGVAQDWPILAHAPAPLPVELGSKTISVCNLNDAVCDYDEEEEEVSAYATAIHTSYTSSSNSGFAWTAPLYQLVKQSAPVPTFDPINPAVPAAPVDPAAPAQPVNQAGA